MPDPGRTVFPFLPEAVGWSDLEEFNATGPRRPADGSRTQPWSDPVIGGETMGGKRVITSAYLNLFGGLVAAGAVLAAMFTVLYVFNRHRTTVLEQVREAESEADGARRDLARSQAIIEGLRDGLVTLDVEGRIRLVNPAASRILGRAPEDLKGSRFRDHVPEFDPVWRYDSGDMSREGEDVVVRARLPSGETIPVSLTVGPLGGEGGDGLLVSLRDRREQTFNEELEGIARSIDTHILLGTSMEGIAMEVCDRVAKLFAARVVWFSVTERRGTDRVIGVGGAAADRLPDLPEGEPGDDGRGSDAPVLQARRLGRAQVVRREGDDARAGGPPWLAACDCHAALCLPLWSDNTVGGVLALGFPGEPPPAVARRHLEGLASRLATALRTIQDQARLRLQSTAMGAAANAIFITDAEGRIEWVNEAFTRLSGFDGDEVMGSTPKVLKSGEQAPEVYTELWSLIQRGRVWRGEMTERRKDGRTYVVDQTITPILDDEGRVTHYVAVHEDVTARKKAEERVRYLSNYDTLTRLPNRVLFRDRLYQAVVQARRSHTGIAVMFIDLAQFSRVNDTLGHAAGDQMLMTIASRINAAAEEADTVARVGGDEFALIQTGVTSAETASGLARRLIDVIQTPVDLGSQEVRVGANVGIAIYPQDGTDPDNLMKNADLAMYRAIKSEDDNCSFFSTEMNAEAAVRLGLEGDLRRALDGDDELHLHFQLQYGLETGAPVGVEALVRWNHPDLGAIPPVRFIPVAEDSGLMHDLGDWVLDHALAEYARWRAAGGPRLTIAVNISAVQFRQKGLVERVTTLLETHGVDPHDLEMELTESMLMQDAKQAVKLLEDLSKSGIRLAIDDFGTGYSSLSYLKQFRVDKLKVDQSFVRHVTEGGNDAVIARAIINLGHSLGLEVIAEGVETEGQLAYLRDEGCDVIQGFLLARPEPSDTVLSILLDRDRLAEKARCILPAAV
jgi:diguanylate cyclase (GGDEF)-like protein/PAS domain S-box-containing protein